MQTTIAAFIAAIPVARRSFSRCTLDIARAGSYQTAMPNPSTTDTRSFSRGNRGNSRGFRGRRGNGGRRKGTPRAQVDPFSGPAVIPSPAPAALPADACALVWFRNDLRVRDHAALALGNSAAVLVPMYVFDTSQYGPDHLSPHGFQRTGPFRAAFQKEAVRDLRQGLRMRGADMVLRLGDPVEEIVLVARQLIEEGFKPLRVIAHKEVTWEETEMEKRVEKALKELGEEMNADVDMHFVWGATLHHLDDLPFNPGGPGVPDTFTSYRKLIESHRGPSVREEIKMPGRLKPFPLHIGIKSDEMPNLGDELEVEGLSVPNDYPFPHPLACTDFKGGQTAAEERMNEYIWQCDALRVYKETRNESGTKNGSSKLSPWLALGCISPRTIFWECKSYEEKREKNESTYWMVFELMTRDYFRWVATSVGTKLFALNGYSGRGKNEPSIWTPPEGAIKPKHKQRFEKWIKGETGAPIIDANMRELAKTGFMSNRGRQNVASFLIHDLEYPDWRAGAEYFESVLIDHDVASNWANWAYLAGVGSDPRGGRKFNVIKQSMQYDPDGWFLIRWCPELVDIPVPMRHEPHTLSALELEDFGVTLGETYPHPIVRLPKAPSNN